VRIAAGEIDYLCTMVNRYFRQQIGPADVAWSYAGVRPLIEDESADPAAVTRDYALEMDDAACPAPLCIWRQDHNYRRLAAEAVDKLAARPRLPRRTWTHAALLPGGDLPEGSLRRFCASSNAATRGFQPHCVHATRTPTAQLFIGMLGAAAALARLG